MRLYPTLCSLLTLAAAASAVGCGDDKPAGPDPNAVTSVTLDGTSVTLNAIGATQQLVAQARNSTGAAIAGKTFTWATSAPSVASVSAAGLVTAVGNGPATITATVAGGTQSANASVTVAQAVAALTLTPLTGSIVVGGTQQITAAAADARGATIASPTVAWSTSSATVATVGNTGLVAAVAPGVVTITAVSGSVTRTATITVVFPDLALTRDSTLSGTRTYAAIRIPAGVTLTASGALTLRATGPITVAGTITGACVPLDIGGDTAVTITGLVNNGCTGQPGATLRIASTGEFIVDGGRITSSGDITLMNNPTLTEAAFPPITAAPLATTATGARAVVGGIPFLRMANGASVVYFGGTPTGPDPGANGTSGLNGGDAPATRAVRLLFEGNATFAGATTVFGQDGGNGGNGNNTLNTAVVVTGGNGANGGLIKVYIGGSLTYAGPANTVRGGRGGNGGNATATSTQNQAGAQAPSATATGGIGGEPGLIDIRSGSGIIINPGSLVLDVPKAGDGGAATAIAATGVDALVVGPNSPAQIGGNATTTGGRGGNTPSARLSSANVGGVPVLLIGGGGVGGLSTSQAGLGGNGQKPQKDGAVGGQISATGGNGGNSLLRNFSNNIIGDGGNGGNGIWKLGNGGAGWNDCVAPNFEPGGIGGAGGRAAGGRGTGGTGAANGANGINRFENAANGGRGGSGAGPGVGGAAGANATVGVAGAGINPNFTPGANGADCTPPPPPPPPPQTDLRLENVLNSGGVVGAGTQTLPLTVGGVNRGTLPVTFTAPTFFGSSPVRVGIGSGGRITFRLSQALVDALPYTVRRLAFCLVNSTSVSAQNAVIVRQLASNQEVVRTTMLTSPNACYDESLPAGVADVDVSGGSFSFDLTQVRLFLQGG